MGQARLELAFRALDAEATILVYTSPLPCPQVLDAVVDGEATTFLCPPTVWRMLIQEDLGSWRWSPEADKRRGAA